jgi:hypothetical protein
MAEVGCPNCREQVIFPQGEPNVFECPECVAELDWNGKHITEVITNRNYLFVDGENFDSHFDPELFADAIDFANEVIDNDKTVLSEFGWNYTHTTTEESVLGSMKFSRQYTGFLIVLLLISVGLMILLIPDGGFVGGLICMAVPTLLFILRAMTPNTDDEDLDLALSVGGSYREGDGSGFVPDSSYYAHYRWKNATFTFLTFKSVSENYFLELSNYYNSGGGENNSPPKQGYMWTLRDNKVKIAGGGTDEIIRTKVHNLEREDLVDDFEQILALKNQLKKKTGVYMPIKIEFTGRDNYWGAKKSSKIMQIIENDSELSELWKKLKQGK